VGAELLGRTYLHGFLALLDKAGCASPPHTAGPSPPQPAAQPERLELAAAARAAAGDGGTSHEPVDADSLI
jgi:hypothetical protein